MQDKTDLIRNWQFCDGSHFQDGIQQLGVPDGWTLHFVDNEPIPGIEPPIIGLRPESVCVSIWDVGGEGGKFGQSPPNPGQYNTVFKVHKWAAPFDFDLVQRVGPLEIGRRYLVQGFVFPDFYGENGAPPEDPYTAAFGISVDSTVSVDQFHWPLTFDTWMTIEREFVAGAAYVELGLSGFSKWGLPGNTFWMHGMRLYLLDGEPEPDPDPEPEPDPDPDPEPLPGGVFELGPESRAFIRGEVDRIIAALNFNPGVPTPPEPEPVELVAWSQNDPRWKDRIYAGGMTFGQSGCLVCAYDSIVSLNYSPAPEPPDFALALQEVGAFEGALLSHPARIPVAYPGVHWGGAVHWRTVPADLSLLENELQQYGATVCEVKWNPDGPSPEQGNQHFVVLTGLIREAGMVVDAEIMDPWDGQFKRLLSSRYAKPGWTVQRTLYGARLLRVGQAAPPEPPAPAVFGIHDESGENDETGARWMIARGLRGLIVRPIYLGTQMQMLDFSAEDAAGLQVIVNLRYSFARDNGGQGALPLPGTPTWTLFVEAAAQTMIVSRGVWGWEIGNEVNNPREFPEAGDLTPEGVAQTYNAIRERVWQSTERPRMAPGALDPYNAQAGDPRQWLRVIWNGINGAEFTAAHGYVRGPDPKLINSAAQFADHPLTWQFLNYPRCVTALLNALPAPYMALPIYITEFNHIWRDGGEGDWGWVSDARAAEIVRLAHGAASECGFAGVALYRWAGDEWRMQGNAAVLGALEDVLRA